MTNTEHKTSGSWMVYFLIFVVSRRREVLLTTYCIRIHV